MKNRKSLFSQVQDIVESAAEKRAAELEQRALYARDSAALAEDPYHADMALRAAGDAEAELRLLRGKRR